MTTTMTPAARLTHLYTYSYLILFALLGTLARLGVQALNKYPSAPIAFPVLWANVGGSFIMGFLIEDRRIFMTTDDTLGDIAEPTFTPAARAAHIAHKKTVPLYVGLATGFCGSFTSFSSFIRDMFLATSNDMPPLPGAVATPRNGGYSFLALLAVLISTVALSLGALAVGGHAAIALHPYLPSLPRSFTRRYIDKLGVLLGWGGWLAAVVLAAVPPHESWRGEALFALVFAPLGCLLRHHLGLALNPRLSSFPLGTFTANVGGTAVLGMAWDLAHAPVGGLVACQVLMGIEDGFCGCLTTVSTWVGELAGFGDIRRAYTYGSASVLAGYVVLLAVMGGLRWDQGFAAPKCS
ncbi:CrcB-like protein-domain-containing protein [Plectosphaerella plurivora]|uniref:CrcB-like protein-domain-containing protein n=1 Tax=Plectosphaerella plurivora TaxID=936078 RepID=A0A9P8VIN1_9PEZI|nr:CrcB-like protein-domain-containing protein [Plectosphaerella plurivora]